MVDEPLHGGGDKRVAFLDALVALVAHAHVRHGVDQQLEGDLGQVGVARHQRHHGGDVAAGAVTAHGRAGGVDGEVGGVGQDPAGGGRGIGDGAGELHFRGQAVIHRHHAAAGGVGDGAAGLVVAVEVAQHPAAAVVVDQHRQHGTGGAAHGAVEAQAHGAVGAGGFQVAHFRHFGGLWLHHGAAAGEEAARLVGREGVEGRPAGGLDHVQHALVVGV